MSELAYIDFERQIEALSLVQLCRLKNKIDMLISHSEQEKKADDLAPITSRLLGAAHFDGDYDEILEDCLEAKWL